VPTTLEALFVVFIFSVPAYITIIVYKARYPVQYYREKQSPIEQAALYIFLGTAVNILTIYFLGLLWLCAILVRELLSARTVLTINAQSNSVGGLLTIIFLLTIAYLAVSVVFSFLVGNILGRLLPSKEPLWVSELNKLKVRQAKADADITWVLVQLKNGDRCLGLVSEFRWIGDKDNTMELVLEKTFYQLANSEKREPAGRALLRSNDILCLSAYPYSD
jgi:hypothetical protein